MAKLCPVCQQPLNEIEKWGVRLDVCQRCQGVWLDQGELEQIVGYIRASLATGRLPNDPRQRDQHDHEHHDDYDHAHPHGHDDEQYEYDSRGRRKRRFELGDLFDIFG